MSKQKPATEAKEASSPIVYEIESQYGRLKAVNHTYNGKTYVQRELTSTQLEAIGELLIESDIFSAVKLDSKGMVNVDAGTVMSHLVMKRMVRQFLVLILTTENGDTCTPEQFNGKASEFVKFVQEVFASFFTLNPDALKDIGALLIAVLGTAAGGGQLIAMLLAGKNSSGQSANTGPKQS